MSTVRKFVAPAAALASVLIALTSCATAPYAANPDNVMKLVATFNAGRADQLAASTALPFLFNGEIVELKEDVSTIWGNFVGSGLTLSDARVETDVPAQAADYSKFADTMEVQTFFKKYLPKGTMLVTVAFKGGTFLMLVDGERTGYPVIVGIKGGPA